MGIFDIFVRIGERSVRALAVKYSEPFWRRNSWRSIFRRSTAAAVRCGAYPLAVRPIKSAVKNAGFSPISIGDFGPQKRTRTLDRVKPVGTAQERNDTQAASIPPKNNPDDNHATRTR